MKYRGYHEDSALPFKRGQDVVIPSGVEVLSTHPKRRRFKTARKQTVRLDRFGCGRSFCVGHVFEETGERVGSLTDRRDKLVFEELFGSSDPEFLVNHVDAVVQGNTVFLPVDNPTVVWAGTGGYWCEVDINLLLEANGVSP